MPIGDFILLNFSFLCFVAIIPGIPPVKEKVFHRCFRCRRNKARLRRRPRDQAAARGALRTFIDLGIPAHVFTQTVSDLNDATRLVLTTPFLAGNGKAITACELESSPVCSLLYIRCQATARSMARPGGVTQKPL
mgnify:CR=1 FL=1